MATIATVDIPKIGKTVVMSMDISEEGDRAVRPIARMTKEWDSYSSALRVAADHKRSYEEVVATLWRPAKVGKLEPYRKVRFVQARLENLIPMAEASSAKPASNLDADRETLVMSCSYVTHEPLIAEEESLGQ